MAECSLLALFKGSPWLYARSQTEISGPRDLCWHVGCDVPKVPRSEELILRPYNIAYGVKSEWLGSMARNCQ